jgi:hypothetical protein
MNTTSSKLDVIKAEEEVLTRVYGGLPLKGLDILRWRKFTTKVITGNTSVHLMIFSRFSGAGGSSIRIRQSFPRLISHSHQWDQYQLFPTSTLIWNIQQTKGFLGEDICHLLPILHSLTGCDSTSRLFGIGKGIVLKRLNQLQ